MSQEIIAAPPAVPEAVNYQELYQEQRAESERLKGIIAAARLAPQPARNDDRRPAVSAESVKRSLGPLALHKLTRDQKVEALGVDPKSVTDGALRLLFGRSNDGVAAKELRLTDPAKYRTLREVALLTGAYGG